MNGQAAGAEVSNIAWSKGLFRLWIVASILWSATIITLFSGEFLSPYIPSKSLSAVEPANQSSGRYFESGPWNIYQKETGEAKVIKFNDYPGWEIYVPALLSDQDLSAIAEKASKQMIDMIGEEKRHRRISTLQSTALIILTPILILLALGVLLGWVVRGFKST